MLKRVYQGSIDSDLFEDFIAQLLHHCGRYPEPKFLIIMDNASWHHSEKNPLQMCRDAGVVLEFLSPKPPDFNPIEEQSAQKIHQEKWHETKTHCTRVQNVFGV